jgi:hypothetical protein
LPKYGKDLLNKFSVGASWQNCDLFKAGGRFWRFVIEVSSNYWQNAGCQKNAVPLRMDTSCNIFHPAVYVNHHAIASKILYLCLKV